VTGETPWAGAEAARLVLRSAGYCVLCDRIVERSANGECPAAHPAAAISGNIELDDDEPVPQLPRFNVAAFLVPPIWGPFHGQWVGVIFLPLWLFVDNVVGASNGRGTGSAVGGAFVVVATLAAQAFFAKRANGVGWRRVADRVSVPDYVRRERVWAWVSASLFAALLGWVAYYRLVMAG
jgi:hypothetical protein